nr:transglutaminaseTgpA domain-containing protein [Bifidobacterium amazonense]
MVVLAGDATFWFMALMLDDRVLVVGALLLAIVWVCSLMTAVAQWLAVGRGSASLITPRSVRTRRQYEKLDQDGRVVARYVGDRPAERGLYRCVSLFTWWHDPFGLFGASRVMPQRDELVVLPDDDGTAGSGRQAADQRLQGQSHSDETGGVRDYAPGDPPKLISWKATAHRGELMTRETGRDVQAVTVVVLDARGASPDPDGAVAVTAAQVDAQVERVLPLLKAASAHRRLVVTDGVRVADEPSRTARLLAAVIPVVDDDADEHAYAARVREVVARQQGVVSVRLLTPYPQGSLAAALRRTVGQDQLHVEEVVQAPDTVEAKAGKAGETAAPAGRRQGAAEPARRAVGRRTAIASRTFTALALIAFFTFAVLSLTSIIAGGWWSWFLGVALALASAEANLPIRSKPRYAARTFATCALAALAAIVLIVLRVHADTGLWAFDVAALRRSAEQTASTAASAVASSAQEIAANTQSVTPWSFLGGIFVTGFNKLNVQLPPVSVDADGDVVLLAVAAAIVIVVRLLLVARRCAPAFALVPTVAFAADYAFMGRETDLWRIVAVALLFLLTLWAVKPERALPALPVTASAVVAALVFSLTPSAMDLAYAVPIAIGNSTGLLTANTINPMVDLKRSLTSGSAAAVLTYKADDRTYLRMATLDDFNGDMWSYDESLAKSAELYGAGIQLGHNADEDYGNSFFFQYDDPLFLYSQMIGSASSSWYGGSTDARTGTTADSETLRTARSLSQFYADVDVTITTLRSRFLPLPRATSFVTGVSGWMRSGSTVYSRDSSTDNGMTYSAQGIGLEPISSSSGFRQISTVNSLREGLQRTMETLSAQDDAVDGQWDQLVSDGVAERDGEWLLLPLTVGDDGSVYDSAGSVIGTASSSNSLSYGAGTEPDIAAGLQMSVDFRKRIGYGNSTTIVMGISSEDPTKAMLAVHEGNLNELAAGDDGTGRTSSDEYGYDNESFASAAAYDEIESKLNRRGYSLRWAHGGVNASDQELAANMQSSFDQIDALNVRARSNYRSLPEDLPDNVTALVKQAKADGVATDGDGYDHQVAAMQWLVDYFTDSANGFTYSLNAPDGDGRSNLDVINDFLDTRSGYCTHYATTLAVLGRAMGVPTRVVLGYNRGAGPSVGGSYTVAAKQLHAWTEAYIENIGWVPFDVTPATTENGSASDATDTTDTSTSDGTSSGDTPTIDRGTTSDGTSDTTDDATTDDGTSTQDQTDETTADAATSGTTRRIVPEDASPWLAAAIWTAIVLCVLAIVSLTPAAARRLRRVRRLALVRRGGRRGWMNGWAELCDSAWDAGLRWDGSATDRTIGGLIDGTFAGGDAEGYARRVETLLFAGDAADGAAGGSGEPSDAVRTGLAAIRETGRGQTWLRRVRRFLLPSSLLRRR